MTSKNQHKTLVLGIGNILMGDEGVGVRAVERLEKEHTLPPNVTLLDGGTAGYTLLDIMKDYDRIIIIDAIRSGGKPGTIYRLTAEDILSRPDLKMSGHQIDLPEVIALAKKLGELPEVLLIGMEPGTMDYSTELGPEVNGLMSRLVETVLYTAS